MIHPGAWLAWLSAVCGVVLVLDDPWTVLIAIASCAAVASRTAQPGPEGRTWVLFAKLGALFVTLRVVLFGLTGHSGPTILFTVPRADLPAWLGGLEVGGAVTGEVVAQSAFEGLKIAAVLLAIGVALSAIPVHRLMRALPRFLFEAGLVVGIALAFVPTVARAAREVREAQRVRGHRARGLRTMVAPVLEATLERSMTLAAAMETRGFGRSTPGPARAPRAAVVAGAVLVAAGGALALFGRAAGIAPLVLGVLILAAGLRALGAGCARTRFRPETVTAPDLALIVVSVALVAGAVAARAAGAEAWYPYPVLAWPEVTPAGVALGAALAGPAAITAARRARLVARSVEPATAVAGR